MTPQEAIETIKIAQAEVEWDYPMDYAIAFDVANKALEKQIAKKVVRNKLELFCPVCMENAKTDCGDSVYDYPLNFCDRCGQRLDWGDE